MPQSILNGLIAWETPFLGTGKPDPQRRRVGSLAQNEIELSGVMLDVAHVVEQQIRRADVHPTENGNCVAACSSVMASIVA